MEVWSRAAVESRVCEAMSVLARLPAHGCFPAGYASTMPTPVASFWETWNGLTEDERRERAAEFNRVRTRPSPAAITRLDECLSWRQLVVDARYWLALTAWAARRKNADAARCLGTHRNTAIRWRKIAAGEIANNLNRLPLR